MDEQRPRRRRAGRSHRPRVAILQRRLVAYRVGLFDQLRKACDDAGIELRVVYNQPSPTDAARNDTGHLDWGDEVAARWFTIGGTELLWQPCPAAIRRADLVVLTQENKILSNYPLLAGRALRRMVHADGDGPGHHPLLAFWGHGRNLQSIHPRGPSERWKELLMNQVDWWFAYTGHTRGILTSHHFPAQRITCLDNAIDNEAFLGDLASVTDTRLDACRQQVGLAPGAPLGLYCGALYRDKRIDLMVAVAERVHAADPSFRFVVIGDGPSRPELERLLAGKPWAHWVGARRGPDKAAWFRLAAVLISPGAVGLHVLDSFAAGVPLFTTATALHGPEIGYLDHGRNGFVTGDDPDEQAAAITALLGDPDRLASVRSAARRASERYTLANMVDHFVSGIGECLDAGPLDRRSGAGRRVSPWPGARV